MKLTLKTELPYAPHIPLDDCTSMVTIFVIHSKTLLGILIRTVNLITERKRYMPKQQYLTELMRSSGHIHLDLRSILHN